MSDSLADERKACPPGCRLGLNLPRGIPPLETNWQGKYYQLMDLSDAALELALSGHVPTWLPHEERKLFALGLITLDDYIPDPACEGRGYNVGDVGFSYEIPCEVCGHKGKVLSEDAKVRVLKDHSEFAPKNWE